MSGQQRSPPAELPGCRGATPASSVSRLSLARPIIHPSLHPSNFIRAMTCASGPSILHTHCLLLPPLQATYIVADKVNDE